ncbi:MAG: tRNA-dihydrouridine synthase [Patescibacteria group bacterium]
MQKGFWGKLNKPIFGLSPMDGVTDASFRFIVAKYGDPDIILTEFVSVEGISAGADILLDDFIYSDMERPIVAQIFGATPEAFYKTAPLLCELGFDGIDINMGCPDKNVAKRGGGAGLIRTPELAKDIIRSVQIGVRDWVNGKSLEEFGLSESIINKAKNRKTEIRKIEIPISVKTRIGYDDIVIEEWVKHLLEMEPANISIHGRTLKQMYTGLADWDAIGRAAEIIKKTDTLVLGNGDIKDLISANSSIEKYGLDGVLIGRAVFGNPWIFSNAEVSISDKLDVAIEHAKHFEKIFKDRKFYNMKKHLSWYSHGFFGAKELRIRLMKASNATECESIISEFEMGIKSLTLE